MLKVEDDCGKVAVKKKKATTEGKMDEAPLGSHTMTAADAAATASEVVPSKLNAFKGKKE